VEGPIIGLEGLKRGMLVRVNGWIRGNDIH